MIDPSLPDDWNWRMFDAYNGRYDPSEEKDDSDYEDWLTWIANREEIPQ